MTSLNYQPYLQTQSSSRPDAAPFSTKTMPLKKINQILNEKVNDLDPLHLLFGCTNFVYDISNKARKIELPKMDWYKVSINSPREDRKLMVPRIGIDSFLKIWENIKCQHPKTFAKAHFNKGAYFAIEHWNSLQLKTYGYALEYLFGSNAVHNSKLKEILMKGSQLIFVTSKNEFKIFENDFLKIVNRVVQTKKTPQADKENVESKSLDASKPRFQVSKTYEPLSQQVSTQKLNAKTTEDFLDSNLPLEPHLNLFLEQLLDDLT